MTSLRAYSRISGNRRVGAAVKVRAPLATPAPLRSQPPPQLRSHARRNRCHVLAGVWRRPRFADGAARPHAAPLTTRAPRRVGVPCAAACLRLLPHRPHAAPQPAALGRAAPRRALKTQQTARHHRPLPAPHRPPPRRACTAPAPRPWGSACWFLESPGRAVDGNAVERCAAVRAVPVVGGAAAVLAVTSGRCVLTLTEPRVRLLSRRQKALGVSLRLIRVGAVQEGANDC